MELLVPLSALVMEEYARTVDELAARLGESVVFRAGVRWCTEETAQRLYDEREAQTAALRVRQAEWEARLREQRRQHPIGRGVPAGQSGGCADILGYDAGHDPGAQYRAPRRAPVQTEVLSPIKQLERKAEQR